MPTPEIRKHFICFNIKDKGPGDLYINPENYCTINIKVTKSPDEGCICDWIETDHDDWIEWTCSKCGARVSAEVWD